MIGSIVNIKETQYLVLLKTGEAFLCQHISDSPITKTNRIIDQINTDKGIKYLGTSLYLGLLPSTEVVATVDDPENLTLSILRYWQVEDFLTKIIRTWASGAAPPWAAKATDDLQAYLRWINEEVDYLSRSH